MPLNPHVEALLQLMAQMPPIDFATASPSDVRAIYDNPMPLVNPPQIAQARNMTIALDGRTLPARLYVPEDAGSSPPLTLYFHGGGWVIGTLDTHDGTCRALARASGSAVLSVAYRLAPEHRYPAAVEDAYDSLVWAAANAARLGVDGARLAVAGDSAGGNLAAAAAIMARDRAGPGLRHQLLVYPVTDRDYSRSSYAANGQGEYYLSEEIMRWFWGHYVGSAGTDATPLASVVHTANLSALPPATVITAEYDPLLDEGIAYAERLRNAGVTVDADTATGMIHGFFSMFEAVPAAWPWIERAAANLRRDLA